MTEVNEAEYILCVDWDNNGNYTGTYDDISADLLISDSTPLTWTRGRDKQLARGQAGTLEFYAKNQDGKYSPLNADGDLYGNLQPGRPVRLQMLSGGDTVDQFHGFISRLTPYPWHGKKNVYFYCVDGMEWLSMAKVPITLYVLFTEYTDDNSFGAAIYGATWVYQTFTVTETHYIKEVRLLLSRTGSPGTFTVSIRNESGDEPTGSDLMSGSINANKLPESPSVYTAIPLEDSLKLEAGTTYAIVARATSGDASNKVNWYGEGGG